MKVIPVSSLFLAVSVSASYQPNTDRILHKTHKGQQTYSTNGERNRRSSEMAEQSNANMTDSQHKKPGKVLLKANKVLLKSLSSTRVGTMPGLQWVGRYRV